MSNVSRLTPKRSRLKALWGREDRQSTAERMTYSLAVACRTRILHCLTRWSGSVLFMHAPPTSDHRSLLRHIPIRPCKRLIGLKFYSSFTCVSHSGEFSDPQPVPYDIFQPASAILHLCVPSDAAFPAECVPLQGTEVIVTYVFLTAFFPRSELRKKLPVDPCYKQEAMT